MLSLPASLTDPRFRFEEASHTYFFENRRLDNVTSVLHRWTRPFAAQQIAERVAAREGTTADEILRKWDAMREAGAALGTEVHTAIEADIRGSPRPDLSDEAAKRFQMYERFRDARLQDACFLEPEVRVYSLRLGIAGTVDLLAQMPDGTVTIYDFKTNKRFRTGDEGFDSLLRPFDDLMDNEGNRYALQLALYRLLLAEHGLETDGARIVYLGPDTDVTVVYEPLDLRDRVQKALEGSPKALAPSLPGRIIVPIATATNLLKKA